MIDLEKRTRELLLSCAISPAERGYEALCRAIMLAYKDPSILNKVCGRLYPEVANACGVTKVAVERRIRHAIENAFNRDSESVVKTLRLTQDFDSGKYCNSLFIALAVERLRLEEAQ